MPKEERGFGYYKRTASELKTRANMKGGAYATLFKSKYKEWLPKEGKNRVRILPPTWTTKEGEQYHYGLEIHVNYSIGADNQKFLSLSRHGKGADPIAEARQEAQRAGEKDFAKKLYPSTRMLYWIIDRTDEDEGPLLWAAPAGFDRALANLCVDEDTKNVLSIDHKVEGNDVRFYKEGQGLLTKYDPAKMKVLPESRIHEDSALEKEWMDFIKDNPLPGVLNFYSYDHIAAAFGGAAGRDEDDDDDDKPVTRRKPAAAEDDDSPPRKRKPDPDDDDEKPKGRQHVSHRGSDPDDDDAPPPRTRGPRRDPDDDELPEEAPPRSRKRAEPVDDPDDDIPDEKPQRRAASRQSRDTDDDDAPEEKPARRARAAVAEDDDPPSTRRTKPSKDDGEEGNGSLRERLARRRSRDPEDD